MKMEIKTDTAATLSGKQLWAAVWSRSRFWIMNALLLGTAFTLGWWMHSGARVQAQSTGDVFFQIKGIGPESSMMLYYPDKNAIYVYQGIIMGNSFLTCNYKFQLGKPGAPITRHVCPIGEMK